jgi:large conductance mechanosensitive channel
VVSFFIVAWAIFIMVKGVNRLCSQFDLMPEMATRDCPFCLPKVSHKAVRCAHCASALEPV